jgi:MSHA biogenesis protein MshQ
MMRLLAALWLGAVLSVLPGAARADTPVKLFQSFAGNVNFVGTQKTMRDRPNGSGSKIKDACSVVLPSTRLTASLSGIPADATILSAHLYWAGSSSKADYTITFQGTELTALAERQYFSRTIGGGYDYFGAAVDVTTLVKGNGDYTFSGLTINNGNPWCASQGVVGGFSLLVIYEHASQPFRVLNLYEGFQFMRYSGITLNLSNFSVPNPLPKDATGRLGHITWEGDPTLEQNGEELLFNREEMTDGLNQKGNQFNSKSNINGDKASYGIDFDAYTIGSPVIKGGQKSASTRYQSGQDLVLLNAEIIAVPNVPTADLKMSVTRNGELQAGRSTTYTLNASNLGPSTETGPVTVSVTLSDGLKYESVSGAGWTCTVRGQAISCSAPGPLKKGATLPPITLTVQALSVGSASVSATVAGKLFDNVLGNNTISNTSAAVVVRVDAYAFTVGSCKPGIAIGAAGQCSAFGGTMTAGNGTDGNGVNVFVTAVSDTGVPMALSTKAETKVPLRFSLSCDAPDTSAGTPAVYGGIKLPACAQGNAFPASTDKAWSDAATLTFAVNSPSAQPGDGVFSYDDVGRILLNLLDPKDKDKEKDKTATATVVSRPVSIEFLIKRNSDGVLNPGVKYGVERGFVRAGEEFTLGVGARTQTRGRFAPNFDLEVDIDQVSQGDESSEARLEGDFQPMANGVRLGTNFVWDDVGVLEIVPSLVPNDYLDTGPVKLIGQKVGRFYPAWLQTTTTEPNFSCLPAMGCPVGVDSGAYSRQPFKVSISAFSLKGWPLPNYKGELARNITLAAFDQPGGVNANPGAGTLSANDLAVGADTGAPTLAPVYQLPAPFSAAVPRAAWGAPATIYLRASAMETVASGDDKAATDTISSKRDADPALEAGIRIVNGRLQLSNAFGSELLRLPVPMNAQYWTGSAWANNSADNKSPITLFIDYSGCTKKLALPSRAGSDNCNLDLLKSQPAAQLKDGAGKLWLGAPGGGNVGSAWLQVKDNFPLWLPSTRARVVFGTHRSPVIYMREVY